MVSRIELKHMRIFLRLVREKNVSKVAADAGMTQQAISAYLKTLREEFQHELFLRQSNGLQPTDYAYELAIKFERVITEFDTIFSSAPFSPNGITKTVRIIANEYCQLTLIPGLFREARSIAPMIRFEVIDFDPKTYMDTLASGEADFILGFKEHISKALNNQILKEERYVCVAGARSKIAEEITSINDLANFPYVSFANESSQFGDTIQDFLALHNLKRDIISELSCYTSLQAFIAENDVLAFVPSAIAMTGDFEVLQVSSYLDSFQVVSAWHDRSSDNEVRKWLIGLITTKLIKQ